MGTGDVEMKLPSEDTVVGQVIKLKPVKQAILPSLKIIHFPPNLAPRDPRYHKLAPAMLVFAVLQG